MSAQSQSMSTTGEVHQSSPVISVTSVQIFFSWEDKNAQDEMKKFQTKLALEWFDSLKLEDLVEYYFMKKWFPGSISFVDKVKGIVRILQGEIDREFTRDYFMDQLRQRGFLDVEPIEREGASCYMVQNQKVQVNTGGVWKSGLLEGLIDANFLSISLPGSKPRPFIFSAVAAFGAQDMFGNYKPTDRAIQDECDICLALAYYTKNIEKNVLELTQFCKDKIPLKFFFLHLVIVHLYFNPSREDFGL